MPKIVKRLNEEEYTIAEYIRGIYGGTLSLAEVSEWLNVSPNTAKEWLQDVHHIFIGKRKRWLVSDLARKMIESRAKYG